MFLDQEQSYNETEDFHFKEEDLKNVKELPLWNILPSYQMYSQSFFNQQPDPPHYDAPCSESSRYTPDTGAISLSVSAGPSTVSTQDLQSQAQSQSQSSVTTHSHSDSSPDPARVTFNDNEGHGWQSSVLDHVNKLNNMTETDNQFAKAIKIQTFYTADICKINEPPKLIDPSKFEYKQGDYINGYIKIDNISGLRIPFRMFYLLLQGSITVGHQRKTFLEMFDFHGSFLKYVYINRLVTEYTNSAVCPCFVDNDGSYMSFASEHLEPHTSYKRFFSFRIPSHLLDNECPSYTLSSHVRLPPSMGDVKDFGLVNSRIDYSVIATFIGKATSYQFNPTQENALVFNEHGDEYVILKDSKAPLRIVEETPPVQEGAAIHQDLLLSNLIKRIDERIQVGNKLAQILAHQKFQEISQVVDVLEEQIERQSSNKLQQLYVRTEREKSHKPKLITLEVNSSSMLLKKTALLTVSTPDVIYNLQYVQPKPIRGNGLPDLTLSVPFKMSCQSSSMPKLKSLNVDFACLTISSATPIPLEFNHKMLFRNSKPDSTYFNDHDNFQRNIVNFFKGEFERVKELNKKVNIDNLKFEKSLLDDIKTLALLKEKTVNLTVFGPTIVQHGSSTTSPAWNKVDSQWESEFELGLDFGNLSTKGTRVQNPFDTFTLVPDFQNCYGARLYYLKIQFEFSNHRVYLKVPVSIVKK
ncbi:hypothetical protein CANTEDRAFT_136492 [Yamadazyma tenuis ATCC 10573]|uniref:Bul1 N-terminal domain-containing protein n=1 Tax=Candida tenuis (strain ATCC 10573 / BCRC 21748 / CBS 615 / JCM 9827 / NBRC 10315 / NRRL Y-1498 / VKM Y-70) TaxID=590646 RepID=G3BF11_CANTC|nr:uncharacterized protein CANTEDRAFT_136492 [Yamadazyma tenuis ATCC 10573]XP_006690540.1 uncharacterized protein CANTEDRAFT_136492 [Yamadazyma tenuis ATCC 10573]EGV61325.1 hypothetical protein CANTEDRAFT_136492 [Yamadazyma tenuis ATCC 10573]EGV61326.1 hypothetical protein CANTEDRAFT_136492 [Yamadazyma tenuis ATCC 10573]